MRVYEILLKFISMFKTFCQMPARNQINQAMAVLFKAHYHCLFYIYHVKVVSALSVPTKTPCAFLRHT